jgi:hypothetical protein
MTEQPRLFDVEGGDDHCQYPQLSGRSGHRHGCRCSRCCEAHRSWSPQPAACQHEGCTNPRLRYLRHCDEHRPAPRVARVVSSAPCELPGCGREHRWYESQLNLLRPEIRDLYRRCCGRCRGPHIGVIKRHGLDTAWAIRLITTERCELCDKPFSHSPAGRPNVVIDHDHSCCDTRTTCGRCARGVLCQRCNHIVGAVEQTVEQIGLDRVLAYLERGDRSFLDP